MICSHFPVIISGILGIFNRSFSHIVRLKEILLQFTPLSDFGMILHIVGVNSNIFAHKLIKGINLAHDFHYFDGRVNSNEIFVTVQTSMSSRACLKMLSVRCASQSAGDLCQTKEA